MNAIISPALGNYKINYQITRNGSKFKFELNFIANTFKLFNFDKLL